MSYQELPIACRQCAQRHSQYINPSWSHKCLKVTPMVEGCDWQQDRHPNPAEHERAGTSD